MGIDLEFKLGGVILCQTSCQSCNTILGPWPPPSCSLLLYPLSNVAQASSISRQLCLQLGEIKCNYYYDWEMQMVFSATICSSLRYLRCQLPLLSTWAGPHYTIKKVCMFILSFQVHIFIFLLFRATLLEPAYGLPSRVTMFQHLSGSISRLVNVVLIDD